MGLLLSWRLWRVRKLRPGLERWKIAVILMLHLPILYYYQNGIRLLLLPLILLPDPFLSILCLPGILLALRSLRKDSEHARSEGARVPAEEGV